MTHQQEPEAEMQTDMESLKRQLLYKAHIDLESADEQFGTLKDFPMAKIWIENTVNDISKQYFLIPKDRADAHPVQTPSGDELLERFIKENDSEDYPFKGEDYDMQLLKYAFDWIAAAPVQTGRDTLGPRHDEIMRQLDGGARVDGADISSEDCVAIEQFVLRAAAPATDKILPPLPADLVSGIDASLKQQADTPDAVEREVIDKGSEGQEMCPNCVTPWKCNGPHEPPTCADIRSLKNAENDEQTILTDVNDSQNAEMEAALKTALFDIRACFDPDEWNHGDYEAIQENLKLIERALTKKSRG